jgi:hypothetical protein
MYDGRSSSPDLFTLLVLAFALAPLASACGNGAWGTNAGLSGSGGSNLYTTYSASNGNFWLAGASTINWAKAQVRVRNTNGESIMAGATPTSSCNLCHNSTTYPRITAS